MRSAALAAPRPAPTRRISTAYAPCIAREVAAGAPASGARTIACMDAAGREGRGAKGEAGRGTRDLAHGTEETDKLGQQHRVIGTVHARGGARDQGVCCGRSDALRACVGERGERLGRRAHARAAHLGQDEHRALHVARRREAAAGSPQLAARRACSTGRRRGAAARRGDPRTASEKGVRSGSPSAPPRSPAGAAGIARSPSNAVPRGPSTDSRTCSGGARLSGAARVGTALTAPNRSRHEEWLHRQGPPCPRRSPPGARGAARESPAAPTRAAHGPISARTPLRAAAAAAAARAGAGRGGDFEGAFEGARERGRGDRRRALRGHDAARRLPERAGARCERGRFGSGSNVRSQL
jgi:hypothetical protein